MEVHRYITVAPLMLPHKCKEDVDFEGFDIAMNSTGKLSSIKVYEMF
jgi:hypothetical protein